MKIYEVIRNIIAKFDKRPPKEWFNKMVKKVDEGNPSYDEGQIKRTVGDIWYNKIDQKKREQIQRKVKKQRRERKNGTSD